MVNKVICEYHHNIGDKKSNLSSFLNMFEKKDFDYQVGAFLRPPFKKKVTQDILLYFFRR